MNASTSLSDKCACWVAVGVCLPMCWWISLIGHLQLLCHCSGFSPFIASLANLLPCPSHPCWKADPGKVPCLTQVFPLKFLQCDNASCVAAGRAGSLSQGGHGNLPAVPHTCMGFRRTFHGTSSQTHPYLVGDEL